MQFDLQKNLEPSAFVRTAHAFLPDVYVRAWGATVLLIALDDPKGAVATTLRRSVVGLPPSLLREEAHTVADKGAAMSRAEHPMAESLLAHKVRERVLGMPQFVARIQPRPKADARPHPRFVIGRGRESDLLLASEAVSKNHASIRRGEDGRIEIADNNSRNGTSVNGHLIATKTPVAIVAGDMICIGTTEMMLCTSLDLWVAIRGA